MWEMVLAMNDLYGKIASLNLLKYLYLVLDSLPFSLTSYTQLILVIEMMIYTIHPKYFLAKNQLKIAVASYLLLKSQISYLSTILRNKSEK